DARIPAVPIEIPSHTAIVLNSIGVAPAARIPRFTCSARSRRCALHGMISIHVCATAISGLLRSSSVKPTALSIARAGARDGPSTRRLLLDRREFLLSLSAICFLFPAAIGFGGRGR